MGLLIRTALTWLLAFAIPFQGALAAAMTHCGPGHARDAGAHVHAQPEHAMGSVGFTHHDPAHGNDHPHDMPASAGNLHAHGHGGPQGDAAGGDADAMQHGVVDGDDTGATQEASASSSKAATCSVCASCCTAAILQANPGVFEPSAFSEDHVALAPATPVVFTTDGPERPPRSFLV